MVLKTGSDRTVEPVRPSTGHESGSVCMPKPPVEKPFDNRRTGRFPDGWTEPVPGRFSEEAQKKKKKGHRELVTQQKPETKIASHQETLVPSPSLIIHLHRRHFSVVVATPSPPHLHRRRLLARLPHFSNAVATTFQSRISSRRERRPSSPRAASPSSSPLLTAASPSPAASCSSPSFSIAVATRHHVSEPPLLAP
ncbi:hypothetical protein PIB30_038011 [Stylosanthes scabra]|uniref:Uncharacterized protein n=1 Tax=Stylosanthes scabra TaxID=79078 RepID=A0ABU6SE45_9FABA|nr:hypothetical protein [Stylosanthes scabra]